MIHKRALRPRCTGKGPCPNFAKDVVIVGGCGHVGLPLGLAFADAGCSVVLFDRDARAVDRVRAGKMPFFEPGADALLEKVLAAGRLEASD